jgi:hypothetical protein
VLPVSLLSGILAGLELSQKDPVVGLILSGLAGSLTILYWSWECSVVQDLSLAFDWRDRQ